MPTFIFRRENGQIEYHAGETADKAINWIGQRLSWDGELNTVDVKLPSGRVEKITLTGVKQK